MDIFSKSYWEPVGLAHEEADAVKTQNAVLHFIVFLVDKGRSSRTDAHGSLRIYYCEHAHVLVSQARRASAYVEEFLASALVGFAPDTKASSHRSGSRRVVSTMLAFVRSLAVASALATFALASPTRRALPSGDVTCGSNVYTVSQVSAAVSGGFAHVNNPIGSGALFLNRHVTL